MEKRGKRAVRPGRPRGATTFEAETARALGRVIRERRLDLGISQELLAAMAAVERSHMGKIERGEHLPSLPIVVRLAHALECPPGTLVDRMVELLPPQRS